MVQQHVALVEHLEDDRVCSSSASTLAGCSGGSRSASKPGSSVRPSSTRRSSGPGIGVDLLGGDVELLAQQRQQLLGGRRLDFEPHDVAAPAAPHLALDHLEMRAPALVVELELGVARQADDASVSRIVWPGNSCDEVRADDVFEQHEA